MAAERQRPPQRRRVPETGADPRPLRGRPRRKSASIERRMLRLIVAVLAATWLPGLITDVFSLPAVAWWGIASGYLGLSWLAPGLLVWRIVNRMSSRRSPRRAGVYATAAASLATPLFLLGAASV